MPTSEPMAPGEIARSLRNLDNKLDRMSEKLDARPTWNEIDRLAEHHKATAAEQFRLRDARLDQLEAEVDELQSSVSRVGWAVFSAVMLAVVSVVVGVPPAL